MPKESNLAIKSRPLGSYLKHCARYLYSTVCRILNYGLEELHKFEKVLFQSGGKAEDLVNDLGESENRLPLRVSIRLPLQMRVICLRKKLEGSLRAVGFCCNVYNMEKTKLTDVFVQEAAAFERAGRPSLDDPPANSVDELPRSLTLAGGKKRQTGERQ